MLTRFFLRRQAPDGRGERMSRKRSRWVVLSISKEAAIITLCVGGALLLSQLQPSARVLATVWASLSHVAPGTEAPARQGISAVKSPAQHAVRAQLQEIAKRYDAPPSDARVDSVWKLIPGLNGVRLNIPDTEKQIAAAGTQARLVFTQIPPAISGKDFVAQPIYRGNPQKRQMALMINVAWGTEYVPEILKIFERLHVRATFFLDGSWTAKSGATAKMIAAAGMELGNHAYTHPQMSRLSRIQMISQIERTNQAILRATGVKADLFAPPSGDYNDLVVRVAAGLKMKTILWTIDTIDWRKPSPAVIVSRVAGKRTPGALVLMHPTAPTVAALPQLIDTLHRDGYSLVTVSQLLSPVRPVPATIQDALHS